MILQALHEYEMVAMKPSMGMADDPNAISLMLGKMKELV